jgi:hypothetical protein
MHERTLEPVAMHEQREPSGTKSYGLGLRLFINNKQEKALVEKGAAGLRQAKSKVQPNKGLQRTGPRWFMFRCRFSGSSSLSRPLNPGR